jgi:hypothetical protein
VIIVCVFCCKCLAAASAVEGVGSHVCWLLLFKQDVPKFIIKVYHSLINFLYNFTNFSKNNKLLGP